MSVRFSAPVQPGPGAHAASHTMHTGTFPGVQRSGRGVDHEAPSMAEDKEIVELHLQRPPKKCIHNLTKESTIYFCQHNNICIYFNITYIVILATYFDSYESSSGINIQELLVHIVLQFFMF